MFDLDGTLVDTMAAIPQAYADTIRDLGGPDVTTADVLAAFRVGPTPMLLAHFLGRPVDAHEVGRFFERYEDGVAGTQPLPGAVDLVDALVADGHLLAVVTSAPAEAVYVGDAEVDRACAVAAGCRFVPVEVALSGARRRAGRDRRRA